MSEIVKEIPRQIGWSRRAQSRNFRGFLPTDCCICGRATKRKDNKGHWIIMTEGGSHMAELTSVNMNNPGFMGEYAIGSDCARVYAKELEGYLIHRT